MRPLRRFLCLVFVTWVVAWWPASLPAEWALPWVRGRVSGDVQPNALAGAPSLHWVLELAGAAGEPRRGTLTLTGEKLRLVCALSVDPVTRDGQWRIVEGSVEPGPWWPAAQGVVGSVLDGIVAEGAVALSGEGVVTAGMPRGPVLVVWRQARVAHAAQGWALEGVELTARFEVSDPLGVDVPLALAVRTITTARFGARNLALRATLHGQRSLEVEAVRVEAAGGVVETDPFTVSLAPLSTGLTLHARQIGLQDVVALVPAGLSDARGRADAQLALRWDERAGLQLGDGWVKLNASETAQVTLSPLPGLITGQLPWWNPARLWRPAFRTLSKIETGQTPLVVNHLSAEIVPEGDADHRTARVRISAVAGGDGMRVPLEIDVNVAGLLQQLLKLSLDEHVSLGGN